VTAERFIRMLPETSIDLDAEVGENGSTPELFCSTCIVWQLQRLPLGFRYHDLLQSVQQAHGRQTGFE
jgi:hypothetical protein